MSHRISLSSKKGQVIPLPMTSEKNKIRFNIIDVVLIVVVLAAITSLVFFLSSRKVVTSGSGKTVEVAYQLEFTAMREDFRNLVEIGDPVIDGVLIEELGEVTSVSYADGTYIGTNLATGKPVTSPFPGRITMTLTIRAEAVLTNGGYEVNGRELILGEALTIRVPDFTGVGTCVSVERINSTEE